MTADFISHKMSVLQINVSKGCTHGDTGTAKSVKFRSMNVNSRPVGSVGLEV
jgi:hypothetical protein